jgi:hypothetical protein
MPDSKPAPLAASYKPWTACMSMKTIGMNMASTLIAWHVSPDFPMPHTSMGRSLNYNRSPALTQLTANSLGWGANRIADGCSFRIDQQGLVDCALG